MSRTLVLLRHGRTSWNHEGRIQGHQDIGLDDVGRDQAARVAPLIAALHPSLLWSSDLGRARETAAVVGSVTGLDVVHDERLREFYFGARESLSHAEFAELDPEGLRALQHGDYDAVEGSEPTAQVEKRMVAAVHDLRDALLPGETGVAVSHGGSIRVAVGALLGWPDGLFHTLRGLENCGWAVLAEHPATGVLMLQAYNRTA